MNTETMGWTLQDVAPAGHINEGLTIAQRMDKYGIDPAARTAYNSLLSKERAEAVSKGLAPDVPITPEAAAVFATEIEAHKRAQMNRWLMLGGAGLVVFWLMTRRGRRR